jgi:WD40 repeat protein
MYGLAIAARKRRPANRRRSKWIRIGILAAVSLTLAGTLAVIHLMVSTPFKGPWALLPDNQFVSEMVFSPDGNTLAVGSSAEPGGKPVVTLWDVVGRRPEVALPAHRDAVAFSPDGRTLATAGEGEIQLWDVASRRQIATLPGVVDDVFRAITFSPDGMIVAVVSVGTQVQAWDVASRRKITASKRPPTEVTESPNLQNGFRQALWLWDLPGRAEQAGVLGQTGQGEQQSQALGFTVTGTSFPSRARLRLWDTATHRQITALTNLSERSLGFSPDGRYLADGGEGHSDPLTLIKVSTGKKIANLTHNDSTILARTFSPDSKALAAVDVGGVVRVWHVS